MMAQPAPVRHALQNYYTESAAQNVSFAPLSRSITTETCVIGAGLAGLNVAYELALAGHEVVVVDAGHVGWGASGRNGGFVSPGYALGHEALLNAVGQDHGRKLLNLTHEAVALMKARHKAFGLSESERIDGMLRLSLKAMPQTMAATAKRLQERAGFDLEYWPQQKVAAHLKSDVYGEGLFYKQGFHLHPLNYTRALAWEAHKHGAELFEQTPVTRVEEKELYKTVHVASGHTIQANNVVYACSGYIGGLNRALQYSVVPVATYVMATEPMGAELDEAIGVPYAILDSRFAQDYYRKLPDGRLLWGGRVSMFEPSAEKIKAMLMRDLVRVYPQLAHAKPEFAWGGLMGYARHKMPQIGQLSKGVWYCTAFGGHGLCSTTAGGRVVAQGILGVNDNWKLFEPFGLKFTGGPLVAPVVKQTMYWGYQALDQLTFLKGKFGK